MHDKHEGECWCARCYRRRIVGVFTDIRNVLWAQHRAVRLRFRAQIPGQTPKENVMTLQLTDIQQVQLSIEPLDTKGNPAQVNGVPSWVSSDPSILTVNPSADGMSAMVLAVGKLGNAQVAVSANADMDPAGAPVPLTGTVDFTIVSSQATQLSISAGTPTDQPAPAPAP